MSDPISTIEGDRFMDPTVNPELRVVPVTSEPESDRPWSKTYSNSEIKIDPRSFTSEIIELTAHHRLRVAVRAIADSEPDEFAGLISSNERKRRLEVRDDYFKERVMVPKDGKKVRTNKGSVIDTAAAVDKVFERMVAANHPTARTVMHIADTYGESIPRRQLGWLQQQLVTLTAWDALKEEFESQIASHQQSL